MSAKMKHTEQLELIPLKETPKSGTRETREFDDVLAPNFTHCLQAEKLRADRSKAALSMTLFILPENNGNGRKALRFTLGI